MRARGRVRLPAACCTGDFNGDGQPDVALLMKRQRDGRILPVVFRSEGGRYEVTLIDRIADPYGFNEDPSVWPGPFCHPGPSKGVFESEVGGKVTIVGDLFTVGWLTYFWSTAAGQFDAVPSVWGCDLRLWRGASTGARRAQ